jgi:short-subunit dehydrogenase
VSRWLLYAAAGAGAVIAARRLLRRNVVDLVGKTAVITGGARGLGFMLARRLAAEGCRVAICSRSEEQLARARSALEARGAQVLAHRCDVTDRRQVEEFVSAVRARFGQVDVLVNNAGQITVGPVETFELADFERAMDVMFYGVVHPTLAVMPEMLARRQGAIVNITSIGGKISVPHLLPYNCAKFAAVAFSEGLRAEMKPRGVRVVTIAPGLMRTGSYVNAEFRGQPEREAVWFSLASTLPLVSMPAERAARRIVSALKRGQAERILSLQADLAARFHGLFPGVSAEIMSLVDRLLPAPRAAPDTRRGVDIESLHSGVLGALTTLGRQAGRRMNQPVPVG